MPHRHALPHRSPHALRGRPGPIRTSDLILALLSVVMLGGLALAAAFTLTLGAGG